MKKYIIFIIPIILLIIEISVVWIYRSNKDDTFYPMNEVTSEIPKNINEVEYNITEEYEIPSENIIENIEVIEQEVEKEDSTKQVNPSSTTKSTSTGKKNTSNSDANKNTFVDDNKRAQSNDKGTSSDTTNKDVPKVEEPQKEEPKQDTQQSSSEEHNDTSQIEKKPEEPKQEITRCTTDHNHSIPMSNSGKWYSSASEGIAEYYTLIEKLGKDWENGVFEKDEDYYSSCPYRYEYFSCAYCGKYTFEYTYR